MTFTPSKSMRVVWVNASQDAEVIHQDCKPDAKHICLSSSPFSKTDIALSYCAATQTGRRQERDRVDADEQNFCLTLQGLE